MGAVAQKEAEIMKPFEQCPVCGGELVDKKVEKLLRGGVDVAVLTVSAEVCHRCGERLYREQDVRRFEEIREKLKRQETTGLRAMGQSFEVA